MQRVINMALVRTDGGEDLKIAILLFNQKMQLLKS